MWESVVLDLVGPFLKAGGVQLIRGSSRMVLGTHRLGAEGLGETVGVVAETPVKGCDDAITYRKHDRVLHGQEFWPCLQGRLFLGGFDGVVQDPLLRGPLLDELASIPTLVPGTGMLLGSGRG